MRHGVLIALLVLSSGCILAEPDDDLEEGTALLTVDGATLTGRATYTDRRLDSTWYESIVLEFDHTARRLEFLSPRFECGTFRRDIESGEGADAFSAWYRETTPIRLYWAGDGLLTIDRCTPDRVSGFFAFETFDPTSSCYRCPSSIGPTLSGRFRAVR